MKLLNQNKQQKDYSFYNPLMSVNYPSSLTVVPVTPAGINTISLSQPVATQFYTLGPDVNVVQQNEQKPISERIYGNVYPYQNIESVLNNSKIITTWYQNPYPIGNTRQEQLLVDMNNNNNNVVGTTPTSNLPFFGTNQGGGGAIINQGISPDQSIYYNNANNVLLQNLRDNTNRVTTGNNNLNTQILNRANVVEPTGSSSEIYTFYEPATNEKENLNNGLEISQPGKVSWVNVKKISDETETEPTKM